MVPENLIGVFSARMGQVPGPSAPARPGRRLLPVCRGCASPEWDWAHLVRDYDRAWKGLDGYAGGET